MPCVGSPNKLYLRPFRVKRKIKGFGWLDETLNPEGLFASRDSNLLPERVLRGSWGPGTGPEVG